MMRRTIAILVVALGCIATDANAAIIGFEAESGTLGSDWSTILDAGALGGSYIVADPGQTGDAPAAAQDVASYSVTLASGTYDLYARIFVPSSGPLTPGNADSVFIGDGFGTKFVASSPQWITANQLQQSQNTYDDADGDEILNGVYNWVKFSTQVVETEIVPQFTSAGATETFQIGTREPMWIDAFAFVTSTDPAPTSLELSAAVSAVPEPSTFVLLAMTSGLALFALRRRRR